jgi:E1-E2 ATPase
MTLSDAHKDLLVQLGADYEKGLTMDAASKRRRDDETFNTVDPPIKCPGWVCCLLPCIKSIPSMKAYGRLQPEDAEVKRDGRWTSYDAASVVRGDILRLEEGDVVPADCVVLTVMNNMDLLVDVKGITGEDKPRVVTPEDGLAKLYYGGHVLQGSAIAVVTAIGPQTLLATLIREGRFPPKDNVIEGRDEDRVEQGISLITRNVS